MPSLLFCAQLYQYRFMIINRYLSVANGQTWYSQSLKFEVKVREELMRLFEKNMNLVSHPVPASSRT